MSAEGGCLGIINELKRREQQDNAMKREDPIIDYSAQREAYYEQKARRRTEVLPYVVVVGIVALLGWITYVVYDAVQGLSQ